MGNITEYILALTYVCESYTQRRRVVCRLLSNQFDNLDELDTFQTT